MNTSNVLLPQNESLEIQAEIMERFKQLNQRDQYLLMKRLHEEFMQRDRTVVISPPLPIDV